MPFDLQPTLTGNLLKLRPLKSGDFAELFLSGSDPKIWEQHPSPDRYKREVFQGYFDSAIESKGAFAIIDRATEEIIGSSRYYNLDLEKRVVTIGYTFLSTQYWGGRFNQEMKSLMLNHAFQFVDAVLFEIGEKNLRSRKAIEKIGAQLVGSETLDQKSHVVYRIDKSSDRSWS